MSDRCQTGVRSCQLAQIRMQPSALTHTLSDTLTHTLSDTLTLTLTLTSRCTSFFSYPRGVR